MAAAGSAMLACVVPPRLRLRLGREPALSGTDAGTVIPQPRGRLVRLGRALDRGSEAPALEVPERRLWGLAETARYLGVSEWSVREMEWKGALARVRLPGVRRLLFDSRNVAALVERSEPT